MSAIMLADPDDHPLEAYNLGRFDLEEAAIIDAHLADCESCCQKLYRDAKPQSLMLQRGVGHEPVVKILDFGLTSLVSALVPDDETIGPSQSAPRLTHASTPIGTPDYPVRSAAQPAAKVAVARRQPLFPRVLTLIGALTAAAICFAGLIYIQTGKELIAIETDDPNVQLIVTQNGREVTILDSVSNQKALLDTGGCTLRFGDDAAGFAMSLPENEPFVLRRGEQKIVSVRRMATGPAVAPQNERGGQLELVREVQAVEQNGIIRDVAISSDGKLIFAVGEGPFDAQRPLQVWDAETGDRRKTFRTGSYISLAQSPAGKLLALGEAAGSIQLLNIRELKLSRAAVRALPWPQSISFGPDGSTVANVGGVVKENWAVQYWDWETPSMLLSLGVAHEPESVCVSPDGEYVLISLKHAAPRRQALRAQEPFAVLKLSSETDSVKWGTYAVAWLDSRRALVGMPSGSIALYNFDTEQIERDFTGHTQPVRDIKVLPDSERFLSGGPDGTLRLWSLVSGQQMARKDLGRAATMRIAVSADGCYAVTGGGEQTRKKQIDPIGNGDGKLRLWRLPSGPGSSPVRKVEDVSHVVWGEASAGLQAGIGFFGTDRRTYRTGETLSTAVKLRNVSDDSVQISHSSARLRFVRPKIEGTGHNRWNLYMPPAVRYVFPKVEVLLQPGQEITFDLVQIKLVDGNPGRVGIPHANLPAGDSTISYLVPLERPGSLQTGDLRFAVTGVDASSAGDAEGREQDGVRRDDAPPAVSSAAEDGE